jgi:micrococcal nuclease
VHFIARGSIATALPTSGLETNEAPPQRRRFDWPDFDWFDWRSGIHQLLESPVGQPERTRPAQGADSYEVIDGDTTPYGVKYRLLGFDAPETFRAQCDAELALGRRAAERLKELLDSGEVRVIESGKIDRYGRTLAHLTVNGRDVGGVLIGEGLARAYSGGRRQSQCE